MVTNYYDILKINTSSTLLDIKKAFRKELAIYHPDNNTSPEAKERFEKLVEAFDILSDMGKRKQYDQMLNQKTTNQPIILEQKEEYKEWQKEARTKSETYRDSSLSELFLLDIFGEAAIEGILGGSKTLIEGAEPLIEDIGDVLGDIVGGILDGL